MALEIQLSQITLDTIALQRLCPQCNSDSVQYIPYESDNEIYFECDCCGWELTTKIDLIQDAGFYPLYES
jgi:transcription elongation factor Elf1